MTLEKEGRHRHNVIDPRGKRHCVQREHIQAVIQILAELAGTDFLGHIAIGCRHNAHIHRNIGLRANRRHGLLLQRAEKLSLESHWHLGDFVKKKGAAVSSAEDALVRGRCTGESTLLMAEKDGFKHIVGDGCAIHRDKRCLGTLRMIMDESGKDLFAGARRPVDEDGDICLCNTAGQAQKVTAHLITTGNGALVRQQRRGKLQAIMVGGGACATSRKSQTDELSAKRLGQRECCRVFLDDHHPAGPGGTAACDSGILATDRRLKGGAAHISGRFHLAGSLASGLADRQQPVIQNLGQHRRGVEFFMFKANGAHLFCLKRSFPCQSKGKKPATAPKGA